MDGLDKEAYDRDYSDRVLIRRIVGYFQPHARTMLAVAATVAMASLLETGVPIVISRAINRLTGQPSLGVLGGLSGSVILLGSLSWLFNYVRQSYAARAVGDVVLKLREDAFRAVTQRDLSFYDEFPSGKIVSRVTSDTQDFATVVTLTMDLISQLLLVVVISAVLLSINVRLALITLAISPAVVLVALGFRRLARLSTQRAQRVTARVNALVQELVAGIGIAKAFRQEAAIYEQFGDVNQQAYAVNLRQGFIFSSIFPILNILYGVAAAAVTYYSGLSAALGVVSPGDWYLFVQSLLVFYFPLTSIASFWSQFQQGLSASERVFALIDAEPKVVQRGNAPVGRLDGRVEFRNLHFSYKPGEPVVAGFSLTIPAGQTIAIVGHTGAGKSSLGRLIARFYEFQWGDILVDGMDIRTLDLGSYRRQLGIVPQVPFLFSGSVADNVRYGRPTATDEEVTAVARRVGGGDWIADLPNGLETDVGERGARLSMGQRQLVALARVLLQDPSIFILDEATASVDPFTEAQIQEGLDLVMRDRTSIVIAHRLSTVKNADRIIVMRKGEIIEEGTHDQLMGAGGHYAELYNTYFRHQSLEAINAPTWKLELEGRAQ
ncbi:MAG TPA: ABC transporter ATP-binding protein [Ardenticatenaceae bacterium]|nr:ABC transporter ATP-binding protein [Ardenticatenaceae bacterium]